MLKIFEMKISDKVMITLLHVTTVLQNLAEDTTPKTGCIRLWLSLFVSGDKQKRKESWQSSVSHLP